ncbi:hypothetical protein C7H19_23045 [Aphanothece hegewaldii CCALA 016]|uniref:Lipoprotein n=2 Tax=Aphanothece TaxID=1121 RepID=A0A2T1LRL5_9CHRO|nr:hypothetical protein C7H19_23045 [Aphanothece hegewaldii CCALA 016]
MRSLKLGLILLGSMGLIFLNACSNKEQASNPSNSPAASPTETTTKAEVKEVKSDGSHSLKGGQVAETGAYHLELVPLKEADGVHLDFYLYKGDDHKLVPNAKIAAQVQFPDGTQKILDLPYKANGEHYGALLTEKATGQYQVKITADINGEKVNGRFSFNQ